MKTQPSRYRSAIRELRWHSRRSWVGAPAGGGLSGSRTPSSLSDLRDTVRPPGSGPGLELVVARAVDRGELPDRPRVPDEAIVEIVDDVWLPLLGAPAAADAEN
jgi:hypothetical protein